MRKFKELGEKGLGYQQHYANQHLKKLGSGSARVAYLLSNRFVLKIARADESEKGRAQNEGEVDVYTNPKLKPRVAKVFDFSPDFNWIVAELVRPLTVKEFEEEFNVDMRAAWRAIEIHDFKRYEDFEDTAAYMKKVIARAKKNLETKLMEPEYRKDEWRDDIKSYTAALGVITSDFVRMIWELSEELDLMYVDLVDNRHWGKTADGRIVLLDYGYTKDIAFTYY